MHKPLRSTWTDEDCENRFSFSTATIACPIPYHEERPENADIARSAPNRCLY